MEQVWYSELAWMAAKSAVVIPLLIGVAYLTLQERRVIGSTIAKGPNVVGPLFISAFADALKDGQRNILPAGADKTVFIIAPMLTFVLALVAWAVIPFGRTSSSGY